FAGLRRSEFFELEWSEVDLDERTIEVKAAKAKTRQRRVIHMQDNLREWLMNHRKTKGPICPEKHIDGFSERLRKLAGKAGIDPWPHNAIRHSFGSYFLAKTKDENLTAKEMGNSPQIMHKHYRAVVKTGEADKYWKLVPSICL
ncbi:MAG TPA: site-specific integrase, partial [Verrucomicrobia bacterium]|nr:site-specific integrase [Verrucomicrobiota bacterium]